MKYFVLNILFRTLLKVSCATRTNDVRKPHATRELRCGHPCYIALDDMGR
jgi:hypothetical protein